MRSSGRPELLHQLADLYGACTSYYDLAGTLREADPEALLQVLRVLGSPATSLAEVPEAAEARQAELRQRTMEPVLVAWDGQPVSFLLRLPTGRPGNVVSFDLELEQRDVRSWTVPVASLEPTGNGEVLARLPEALPLGYHRLHVEAEEARAESLILAAPRSAYLPGTSDTGGRGDGTRQGQGWGVFLPTYALTSAESWGIGDLSDLGALLEWVRGLGGETVATLPLLAAYLDEPFEPSPYAPVSRLFWNEAFLDVHRAPEIERCPASRDLLGSRDLTRELRELVAMPLVDYRRVGTVKRLVLTELARCFFADPSSERMAAFREFLAAHPQVEDYAAFRAAVDHRRQPWTEWPAELRDGGLTAADYDEEDRRYHLYAQFLADEQLTRLAQESGGGLYLDLPLGVNPGGYDTWRERDAFALGVSGGAPPDSFFGRGQNWGFPPAHPRGLRASGYRYLIAALRNQMEHASYLRIDHVMWLHRLFWVPRGFEAAQGVYVRYPAEELYALLSLESHRNQTVLIGEDLGTVPDDVRPAMEEHGIRRMYVLQYEARPEAECALSPVLPASMAALNTHDMPTFASFFEGWDIEERAELGHLNEDEVPREHEARQRLTAALGAFLEAPGPSPRTLLDATLGYLAESAAELVLVNLEDLWLETEAQNMPGTGPEQPNWRRKAAYSLEELRELPEVVQTLRRLEQQRQGEDGVKDKKVREAGKRAPGKPRPEGVAAGGAAAAAVAAPPSSPEACAAATLPGVREWSLLSDDDIFLFNEGSHLRLYDHLGSRLLEADGVPGTHFAVWAPNAEMVSVIGDFNGWDPRCHSLKARAASGIWEGFIPGVAKGAVYKYHIVARGGYYRVDKADPFGRRHETPPRTGSVVWDLDYTWGDEQWMAERGERNARQAPLSVYEVHLGSWMRSPEEGSGPLSYREMAPRLAEYAKMMGFTHVELLPVMEHPFYGSWGYQTTGYFAPTSRYGTPQDFMFLVDHLHQHGIGVILDWVPSHFPNDEHGLGYFDGTHLFEHADPRQGFHPDWESLIFNYGRHEVRSFLLSNAMFWLDRYHADGLRVDAVASMLYLDYSREPGEWIPNKYGGRENLEAIEFLRRLNAEVYRHHPDVQTIAEESTSWPMVSRPTHLGGLGFGLKWDMGWMHDTLTYMSNDPIHRKYHHDQLTFRMIYAFTENFLLPLSHDEVVHGKGSLVGKMPGDDWQKFANLRLLLSYQYAQAGKKLLFMGGEFAQWREWHHEHSLDWHLLQFDPHAGVQRLVQDLNRLYREEPALHELDLEPEGFEWIAANDSDQSVISFLRKGSSTDELLLFAFNFTPVPRLSYLVGAPRGGFWREVFNSDAEPYGGSGHGNMGGVQAAPLSCHGRPYCLALTIPPLGAVALKSPGGGG